MKHQVTPVAVKLGSVVVTLATASVMSIATVEETVAMTSTQLVQKVIATNFFLVQI